MTERVVAVWLTLAVSCTGGGEDGGSDTASDGDADSDADDCANPSQHLDGGRCVQCLTAFCEETGSCVTLDQVRASLDDESSDIDACLFRCEEGGLLYWKWTFSREDYHFDANGQLVHVHIASDVDEYCDEGSWQLDAGAEPECTITCVEQARPDGYCAKTPSCG